MPTRILVLLLSVVAAGCAGTNDGEAVSPTTTTNVSTTTTTAADPTGVLDDDSRLSFEGIGAVRAGMTLEEAETAAGVPMARTELPACVALSTEDMPRGVDLVFPGGGVLEFVFAREGSLVKTTSGVALGDEESVVLRAHPDAEVINPGVEVHRIVVRESENGRRLLFEIERGRVSVMWSGPNGSERADEICS